MRVPVPASWPRVVATVASLWLALAGGPALAAPPSVASGAAAMHKAYHALPEAAGGRQRVHIESSETPNTVAGKVAGVVAEPFATVRDVLSDPGQWCDLLMLHMNNKSCRLAASGATPAITLKITKRYDDPIDNATPVTFGFRVADASAEYLAVRLDAAEGPFWTRNHRIHVEAIPVGRANTFLRVSYSYGFGTPTRMISDIYFATIGRDKVGFTELTQTQGAGPQFIGGVRGLMERNTLRYFLAADAHLTEHGAPGPGLLERRLRHWFDATERRPRQLHEMDLDTYLALKRREYAAQAAAR